MSISDTHSGMMPSTNDNAAPVRVSPEDARQNREVIDQQLERITELESMLAGTDLPADNAELVGQLNQRILELENVLSELATPEAWALSWARESEPWVRIRKVLESNK